MTSTRTTWQRRRTCASITGNSNLKVIKRPAFNVAYVGINSAHAPFNNKLVRQAVAYGLDRESVVKNFYYGTGQVAHEFDAAGPARLHQQGRKYPYDPEKAKALLRQAGLTLPVKVEFWYPTGVSRPYMPDPKRNFEAFAASLENSGLQGRGPQRTVAPRLRREGQRRHRRRSEPDRLDRRLR